MKHNFLILDAQHQIVTPSLPQSRVNTSWVSYGTNDDMGEFLYELYRDSTYLKACVDTMVSEVTSDEWTANIVRSLVLYGGAPLLVRRESGLSMPSITLLDHRWIHLTGDRSKLRYQPRMGAGKVYYADSSLPEYFIYLALDNDNPYPNPFIYPSIKAVQSLLGVHDHNVSSLSNGFSSSALISFNNGVPDDETAEEIERSINRKFCGAENAGRVMVSFANDQTSAPTVQTIPLTQFQAQFDSLVSSSKEQIFANFRATPALLGMTDEAKNGFSANEYRSQYALFLKFTVLPMVNKVRSLFMNAGLGEPVLNVVDNDFIVRVLMESE